MRIRKLKRILKKDEYFPYLITDLNNIKYLTGFEGSNAFLFIDEKDSFLISDSRYEEYIESLLTGSFKFHLQEGGAAGAILECMNAVQKKNIFIESHNVTLTFNYELKKALKKIKIIPVYEDPVSRIRELKDEEEIDLLREACVITDRCFMHLLNFIKPGLTEWEIAVEIDYFYKKNGCTACSFDPIVASGPGASMPHYKPSQDKKIARGDVLLIDMGCLYRGYNSDLTRTIFLDSIDSLLGEIYNIVYEAQIKAVSSVKPGINSSKLDSIARNIISDYGYGDNFGHGLGHGVGIEIHEPPAIKKFTSSRIKKNMVITIEPGIYIPGKGGVRIEDTVLVTSDGCEILTKCSKELIVI
ncbi:MAG TPA: aminopeptidase P family protein [Spirochaetota bacterium]|nr:aminopeptidase P family protein [Spirochaetota bacterium]